MWLSTGPHLNPRDDEPIQKMVVRYRTVGDMTCTGAVESSARTSTRSSSRRLLRASPNGAPRAPMTPLVPSMEDRKREGYF